MNGNASEVLCGSAELFLAPKGTALPAFDGTYPVVLDPAFKSVGYTKDGTELNYQPTYKDIEVDEEDAPVQTKKTGEKATIAAKLAQSSLDNIARAVAGAKLVEVAAGGAGKKAVRAVKVGSGDPVEYVAILKGLSPDGLDRYVVGYRAIPTANVALAFKKNDETIVPLDLKLLADSSKPKGERLYAIYDYEEPAA